MLVYSLDNDEDLSLGLFSTREKAENFWAWLCEYRGFKEEELSVSEIQLDKEYKDI